MKRKAFWSRDEGIQWWFWYAIIERHHLSPSRVLEYRKGWKGALRSPMGRWPPRGSEQEWTISIGQGGTVGVWQSLSSCYTGVCRHSCTDDCPERFKAKISLSWYLLQCREDSEQSYNCTWFKGVWYTQLFSRDNSLFHLPDILEMPLVIVVFESKASIRLVCLQPLAVIAGEKFPSLGRYWACHTQGSKGVLRRASVETDGISAQSSVQPAAFWYCSYFLWSQKFFVSVAISGDLSTAFILGLEKSGGGSVCLLHWPHPRCSSAVLVHIDKGEGTDKQLPTHGCLVLSEMPELSKIPLWDDRHDAGPAANPFFPDWLLEIKCGVLWPLK